MIWLEGYMLPIQCFITSSHEAIGSDGSLKESSDINLFEYFLS